MNRYAKVALSAVLLAGAMALGAIPASAQSVGFSFGYGPVFSDPCAYYDYYDQPPPWGLPPDYCDYPVYFEPVFVDGYWYRGPIYYRWQGGERLFWLNGGWRRDQWRGPRPQIRWQDRGAWGHVHDRGGWSGGRGTYDGADRGGYGRDDHGGGDHWSGGGGQSGASHWSGGSGHGSAGAGGHWSGRGSGHGGGIGHGGGGSHGSGGGGHHR
jgi:hypothetical protein